jgi:hypothetical protein
VQDLDLDSLRGTTPLAALRLRFGRIGLHNHTGSVRFRNIELKDDGPAPELFNGKDLTGWESLPDVWQVKDGLIVASSFPRGRTRNTFLCSHEQYKDFELEFDAKVRGNNNSGVMIRSVLHDRENYWLKGIKCDLGHRTGWGTLVTYDGKNGRILKMANNVEAKKATRPVEFNHVLLRCVGKKVVVRINGVLVHETELAELAAEGVIAFQLRYGTPMEIALKNIRLRRLDAAGPEKPR